MKKLFLKNLAIFMEKLHAYNFIRKRLQHRCFPLNIAKFINTYFDEHLPMAASDFLKQLQNSGELPLY